MKYDVTQTLKHFTGEPLMETRIKAGTEHHEKPEVEKVELTLRSVLCQALMVVPKNERDGSSGNKKVERFLLAKQVYTSDEVEFSVDDVVMLKGLVEQAFEQHTPTVAAVFLLLDPSCAKGRT